MIRGRLRPLLVLLALLGAALIGRLFQVQVLEHDVWAQEAARLVRQGREEPYRRGRILDAAGRVLARDERLRTVVLVYRDFRRDHPLGQVAHARSLLAGRPVTLPEAHARLGEWAHALVALGPREVGAFARGEGEARPARALDRRQQAQRATDLVFYIRRLLELDGDEQRRTWSDVLALAEEEGESRSFLALAARVRRGDGPQALAEEAQELDARLARSLERLGVLARWIRADADGLEPLDELVAELEGVRRSVEDATAAKLFAEATGFAPGRIEADTLRECFDHAWITTLLGWNAARMAEWAGTVRAGWRATWRDGECLPQVFASLAQEAVDEPGPGDFLARLAVAYMPEGALDAALELGPRPWRELDELAVFAVLGDLFAASVPAQALALGRQALPIQLAELRADPDDARLLPAGEGPDSFRARLARSLAGRIDVEQLLELAASLSEVWELRFQETLRQALELTRRGAARDELGPEGGLILAAASRERAAERAEFFLKDYGSRPRPLASGELSYDVVYLLTRFESDYPGFQVRDLETRARVELAGDDVRPAERLLGRTSAPTLEDFLRQRRGAARLRALKDRPEREEEEEEELKRLIGEVRLPHEVKGIEGVEAFFEPELAGTNGFSVTRGLSDLYGPGVDDVPVRAAVDGQDVVLTLDALLQAAAQRCLRQPSSEHEDDAWERDPVGAVVLLSIDGDVLAAASEPDDQSRIDETVARGQRLLRTERTLRKPTFQPPGSVFKIFVAAWALEHGLDPTRKVVCGPIERGGAGYADLRCWNTGGHGAVDLHAALVQSCNAYFAWLGETLTTADLGALSAQFGFGEPTGVRTPPPWDEGVRRRTGLGEDRAGLSLPADGAELSAPLRRMAANGLGKIEATPMQLARGILALARGEKRALRLVQRIGEREVPRAEDEPLALGARTLDFVRAAMRGVAEDPHGTAHNALSSSLLGFSVALKTGSADLESRKDEQGQLKVRKHAWVGGWAPAEEPELVFVVFEHDTSATSSHGAVYLAREILRQPEVLLWLAERGVDVSGVPAR